MAPLRIYLLGQFKVTLDDQELTGFESNKVRALLALLAAEPSRTHAREELAELLWPERPAGNALANLRHALGNLRRTIGDRAGALTRFIVTSTTLRLNPAGDVWVDLGQFDALIDGPVPSVQAWHQAVTLCRGPFLQSFALDDSPGFDEWMAVLRERIDRRVVHALAHLVGHAVHQGDFAQAAEWTRRQVAQQPWNEDAHRQLILLLAADGQRATALRQFAVCTRLLAEEAGVAPDAETVMLAERVRAGAVRQEEVAQLDGKLLILPPTSGQRQAAHLPLQHTPLFGRGDEMALVAAYLADPGCRLMSVVGPGGIGKTRLAIEATLRHGSQFAHGICYVPLIGVQPEFLISAILQALDIPVHGLTDLRQQLLDALIDKETLLVLDNFEQMVDHVGVLLDMLAIALRLKILVTSRSRLNLALERLIPLEGLVVPPESVEAPTNAHDQDGAGAFTEHGDGARLDRYGAIQLFLYSLRRTRPGFALAPSDWPAAVRICRLLSGIPLAIELAAAWAPLVSLPAMLDRLQNSMDLLSASLHDIPVRHRSMRAVFDISWEMLTAREQDILWQLTVFCGGCTAAAAASVTGASLVDLSGLMDKSWLRVLPTGRVELHELTRQYCAERLAAQQSDACGEPTAQVRIRHGRYYAAYLHDQIQQMNFARGFMDDVLAELGNLQGAWQWTVQSGSAKEGVDLAITFFFVAETLGWFSFALQLLEGERGSLECQLEDPDRRSTALSTLCWVEFIASSIYRMVGRLEQSRGAMERLLHLTTTGVAPADVCILSHFLEAMLLELEGRITDAKTSMEGVLHDFETATVDYLIYGRDTGPKFFQGHGHLNLARHAYILGDYADARWRLDRALKLYRGIGEQRYQSHCQSLLARLLWTLGEYGQAAALAQEALAMSQAFGDRIGTVHALIALGCTEAAVGSIALATVHLTEALESARQSGNLQVWMESFVALGRLELAVEHSMEAERLFREALDVFAGVGTAHSNFVVGAVLGLGWVALADGDLPLAQRTFLEVPTARGCAAWEALDAAAGLAEVYAAWNRLEHAAEFAELVLTAPAAAHITRSVAKRTLARLGREAPPAGSWVSDYRCKLDALLARVAGP